VIRDNKDFHNHLDYIHFNPVHHSCTRQVADYQFSSFHDYVERGWYNEKWGNMVPDNIKTMNLE
jgi:putative transposase